MIDSTIETKAHTIAVEMLVYDIVERLLDRCKAHDASKTQTPERQIFDEFTEKLRGLTYGSDAYKACLVAMKPALDHHYASNSHHPEHYINGVVDMDLIDVVEMLADWKAASTRHADGDIMKSLEINQKRFSLSPQLYSILLNTVRNMGW